MSCPCGNSEALEQCCGRYLSGDGSAPTAEALMRSRYAAYALDKMDYIVETHEPATRSSVDREAAHNWAANSEWLGLEIVATEGGQPGDLNGMVEFRAKYAVNGHEITHHERSTFRQQEGRWYYVDGDIVKPKPIVRDAPKVGRNEPCACGSGKKYKRCCGQAA